MLLLHVLWLKQYCICWYDAYKSDRNVLKNIRYERPYITGFLLDIKCILFASFAVQGEFVWKKHIVLVMMDGCRLCSWRSVTRGINIHQPFLSVFLSCSFFISLPFADEPLLISNKYGGVQ